MRNLIYTIMMAVACVATVASCGGDREYSRWVNLSADGWAYGDSLTLVPADTSLADNDSIVHRRLMLGLSHTNDYAYSNLWLEVTYSGDGCSYRDTVNIMLADVYGTWLGSGFGANYQHEVVLNPEADVDLTRPVVVRHIMRVDTLKGIDKIGVSVR